MAQIGTRPISRDVHHHPDAHRSGIVDVELAGTDERDVPEPSHSGRGGGKGGMDVIGGGEQDADDVVVVHAIAPDHLLKERDSSLLYLLDRIDVDGGGTTKGSH